MVLELAPPKETDFLKNYRHKFPIWEKSIERSVDFTYFFLLRLAALTQAASPLDRNSSSPVSPKVLSEIVKDFLEEKNFEFDLAQAPFFSKGQNYKATITKLLGFCLNLFFHGLLSQLRLNFKFKQNLADTLHDKQSLELLKKLYIYLSCYTSDASEWQKNRLDFHDAMTFFVGEIVVILKFLSDFKGNRESNWRPLPCVANWDKFFAAHPTISIPAMAKFFFTPELIESSFTDEVLSYFPDELSSYTDIQVPIPLGTSSLYHARKLFV